MKNQPYGYWSVATALLATIVSLFVLPAWLSAQTYPSKPINLLASFAPGGTVDITIRLLAKKAEKFLGQPFAVDNNGGGGGTVALGIVARAKPDGYQLVSCTSVGMVGIPQFRPVSYKLSDFVPIMHYGAPQSGLGVRGDSPWKTMKEFVDYAKKNPGKVTYSTNGVGTTQDMAMKYIAQKEGIKWTVVPFPGVSEAFTALLGGHVTSFSGSSDWAPFIKEGRVRLLATHGETRMKAFPNVPTFRELGYNYVNPTRFMVAAPKGTPQSIVERLDEAFAQAVHDPEFVALMETQEIEVLYRHPQEMVQWLEDQRDLIGKMIRDFDIPTEFKEPKK
jgi:tripartite-type tricarboxylate transporter receptor subunit TctC